VIFGTTVEIANTETDETVTYQIVGDDEADIKQSKLSVGSPIARALIGKEEGDVVVVKTPGGNVEYEIVAVRHV
jgi:transcription elongation factor GreA